MFDALLGPVTSLLDKVVEDKDQKNQLAHEIATIAQKQAHAEVMGLRSIRLRPPVNHCLSPAGDRPLAGSAAWPSPGILCWHRSLSLP